MARFVDLVLCIFPFEAELYNESGLRTVFVGHPMIETLQPQKIGAERDPNSIGLFPGSRLREVRKIFPVMIEVARLLLQSKPGLRFHVAAASEGLLEEMRSMLMNEQSVARQAIDIVAGQTAALMQRAWVGIVASGSATLEAAYFQMPFVLIYKVTWPTYIAGRLVVSVDYLGMPNLLADKEVIPEFIQHQAKPAAIAKAVLSLMEDPKARDRMISEFHEVVVKLGGTGASNRAARAILQEVKESRSTDQRSRQTEAGRARRNEVNSSQ
jgi:lipid-A-disaccharide synthase